MVDVKVCSKCGSSIPGQDIIDGKAQLVNGQLVCGTCASSKASQSAPRPAAPTPISLPDDGPPEAPAPAGESPAADSLTLEPAEEVGEEITVFGGREGRKEVTFNREPHATGQGAIRIRTFDSKLSRAAFEVLDEQINIWLDETGYEIKHVTANIGEIHGKTMIEQHLIINVWY